MPLVPLPQVKIEPTANKAKLTVEYLNPDTNSIKADGKYWGIRNVGIDKFKQGGTYEVTYLEREGKGKWAGRTFLDITTIIETPGSQPALNGAAKDQRITELALMKLVQIPYGTREAMGNAMTEVWLAARDACDRMLNDDIPY